MKALLLNILLLFSTAITWAQDTYVRTYGSNSYDHGRAVKQLENGGFIICGATASRGSGNTDSYLLNVDASGALNWTKTYGTEGIDWATDVLVLEDGFLLIGYSDQSATKGYDGYVVRTDLLGKVVWEKFFGGNNWDFLYKGLVVEDGGVILVGETHSYGNGDADVYVVKIDLEGNKIWENYFGDERKDWGSGIIKTSTNNYMVLTTWTNEKEEKEIKVLNIDLEGKEIERFILEDSLNNEALSLVELDDGGYVIVGTTMLDDKTRMLTLGVNSSFEVEWKKIDPKSAEQNDVGRAIAKSMTEDKLLIMGRLESYGAGMGDFGYYLRDGKGVWESGGTVGEEKLDDPYSVIPCKDGGFVMVGTTESYGAKYSSVVLIRINDKGEYNEDDYEHHEDVTPVETINFEGNVRVIPNPFSGNASIEISQYQDGFPIYYSIHSIDGKLMNEFSSYTTRQAINSNKLGAGMYFIKISNSQKKLIYSGKIITF